MSSCARVSMRTIIVSAQFLRNTCRTSRLSPGGRRTGGGRGSNAANLAAQAEAEREAIWQAGFGNALLSQSDAIGHALNLDLLLF